jgi:uncharacterized damage-inducible protein DinB
MSIAESLLPEFDHEMATTRKFLGRTPETKLDWKPHDKSMSLGTLAAHLVDIPSWGVTLDVAELDIKPKDGPAYTTPEFGSTASALARFDGNVAAARAKIASMSDAEFVKPWSLLMGGQTLFTMPRVAVARTWVLNHIIHHRAQYGVYLRLNNVPIPGSYGPSADETGM